MCVWKSREFVGHVGVCSVFRNRGVCVFRAVKLHVDLWWGVGGNGTWYKSVLGGFRETVCSSIHCVHLGGMLAVRLYSDLCYLCKYSCRLACEYSI